MRRLAGVGGVRGISGRSPRLRIVLSVAAVGAVAACAAARRTIRRRGLAWTIAGADGPIEIRRDEAGVPHVSAASPADALRGLGHCHGVDRPVQIVLARLIGQGRAAEVLNADAQLVALDTLFRRLDLGREAEAQVTLLTAHCREQLEAYCSGVSEAFTRRRPWELMLLRHRPEPWRPADVVLLSRMMGYLGLAQTQGDMERVLVELVQAGVDRALLEELLPDRLELLDVDLLRDLRLGSRMLPIAAGRLGLPSLAGSNAWAVAPERTRDGSSLLAGDPHLDVNRMPAAWYEAVLDHGERWCAGATMPGLPAVLIGRSADVAWGLTYGAGDAVDSWVEDCREGRFMREVDGERRWVAFTRRDELVRRRGGSPLTLSVFESEHGVLDGDPRVAGRYLCTRWASAHGSGAASLTVMLELFAAPDVAAAAGLLRNVEFSFNWVLADRGGAIAHQMSGRIPRRRRGNGLLPLSGADPENDWDGYLSPEDLPRITHPRDGFVASANEDVNHLAQVPVNTLPFAPYRAHRIAELLGARSDWTVADFERMQMDRVSLQARRFLEVLRPLLAQDRRFDAVAAWNCAYDDDSRPAAWFETFYSVLVERALIAAWGEAGRFIVHETAMVAAVFGLLDDVLLNPGGGWHGTEGRDAAFLHAAERAFATAPATLAERQPLVMGHLLLHGRVPGWAGFDRRPGALRGGRATIHQGQRLRSGGRDVCVGPSYRMVTDLAESALRTALPGGPSERRFSRWYAGGVADWWSGCSKTLAR
ncbi:MAG: penicillin acylase family protein [Solirubrobacteraceae bacterium]